MVTRLAPFRQLVISLSPVPVTVTGFSLNGQSIFGTLGPSQIPKALPNWCDWFNSEAGQRVPGFAQTHRLGMLFVFPLRLTDSAPLLGVLVLAAAGSPDSMPALGAVHARVAPVLALMAREISSPERASASPEVAATMLLKAPTASETPDPKGQSEFTDSVGASVRTLDDLVETVRSDTRSDAVLLLAPERGLTRLRSSGRFQASDAVRLRNLVSAHFAKVVHDRAAPLIINKVRDDKTGELLPYRFLCAALRQGASLLGTIVCVRRISEPGFAAPQAAALAALREDLGGMVISQTDDVTGLLTRAAFEIEAQRMLLTEAQALYSIVHINVDRLHVVNELFGFETGNAVLRSIGTLIRDQSLRHGGLACRMNSDQFAVLLLRCRVSTAQEWACRLLESIQDMTMPQNCAGLEVTASMGVAESQSQVPVDKTIGAAETATKAAKDRGRNRVEVFTSNDASLVQRHEDVAIFRRLVAALRAGEFQLYAQPIVSLVDKNPAPRFEILLRMLDRDGRIIAPKKFMSAATRYQLLPQLDRWVLSATLQALAPHAPALLGRKASFSVNLSGPTIAEPDFCKAVRTAFHSYDVPPALVSFEITESSAIGSLDTATRFMSDLRAIGCRFALDDFGTGLSSLSYLKDLKVSTLKIDGSFIRDLATNPNSQTIVRAIMDIAKKLGLETVAEYVESVDLVSRVTAMGVTYAQGYAFGMPRPLTDVLAELELPADLDNRNWYAGRVAARRA